MLKYAALLFNTIALLIYQFFFAEGITITQNVPSSAKPDSEFTVEIIINKGTVSGFAKLQQDLPEGFTAIQDESSGANFTFSAQSVKFIWMSLPNDKEFKIKYKVKVAAGIAGDKTIGGKFSYVSDNVKQSVDVPVATIRIGDGSGAVAGNTTTTPTTTTTTPTTTTTEPTTAATNTTTPTTTTTEPATTTNTTATTTPTTTEPTATGTTPTTNNEIPTNLTSELAEKSMEASGISCSRTVTPTGSEGYMVEVMINKGNVSGFAKLLETLPAGFTATGGETQGASFSFDAATQKVKFVWVSMPSVTEFRVSYRIAVSGASGTQPIDGVFSYIENDETKKFVIPTSMVTIGGAVTTTTNTTTPTDNTTTTNNTTATNTTTTTTTPDNTTTTTTPNTTKDLSATTVPSPQGNVNYRVQIMALYKPVDANVLASRYNINARINTEMADGFTKYTVGSHNEYKEARDAREDMRNKGVVGPFVAAYNTGKRITVQEALMITSQKWYR